MGSSSDRGCGLPPFQGVIAFAAFPGVFAALDTPAILCQAFGLSALARGSQTGRRPALLKSVQFFQLEMWVKTRASDRFRVRIDENGPKVRVFFAATDTEAA